MRYLRARRAALGGVLPRAGAATPRARGAARSRATRSSRSQADGKEMSTTMAVVRMLGSLLKDPALGPRIVPIVADEARTFGMANLFRQIGIYSPVGQLYEPEDAGSMLVLPRGRRTASCSRKASPRPARSSSWTAAATSYSVHGLPMLPFYIYYSMFGFQRVGDLIWAAADQRARGFLLGATAGRTTLGGEGLQHQDGTQPRDRGRRCRTAAPTIPAFACELAVILDHGMRRMLERAGGRVLLHHGDERELRRSRRCPPARADGIMRGMYRLRARAATARARVRLLGSGAILREVDRGRGAAGGRVERRRARSAA